MAFHAQEFTYVCNRQKRKLTNICLQTGTKSTRHVTSVTHVSKFEFKCLPHCMAKCLLRIRIHRRVKGSSDITEVFENSNFTLKGTAFKAYRKDGTFRNDFRAFLFLIGLNTTPGVTYIRATSSPSQACRHVAIARGTTILILKSKQTRMLNNFSRDACGDVAAAPTENKTQRAARASWANDVLVRKRQFASWKKSKNLCMPVL